MRPRGHGGPFEVYGEALGTSAESGTDGRTVYTGFFLTKIVNVENDKEITLVSQGPGASGSPDGQNVRISSQGPIIFFFFPGDAGPGDDSVGRT